MSEKSKFTPDQIKKLRESPHVLNVTKTTVSFTNEFKQIFFDQRHSSSLSPEEILFANGIDPEILGSARIRGFVQHVEEQADRDSGFNDLRAKENKELRDAERLKALAQKHDEKIRASDLAHEVTDLKHEVADMKEEFSELKALITKVLTQYELETHVLASFKKKQPTN